MCRSRLPLKASVKTSTFSFAGYDAVRTAEAVSAMHFQCVNFAILYIGGNDLANVNAEPQEMCDNIGHRFFSTIQKSHNVRSSHLTATMQTEPGASISSPKSSWLLLFETLDSESSRTGAASQVPATGC
ncbi:hypothetical protein MRX96_028114 [Rhipicephalus microplus]